LKGVAVGPGAGKPLKFEVGWSKPAMLVAPAAAYAPAPAVQANPYAFQQDLAPGPQQLPPAAYQPRRADDALFQPVPAYEYVFSIKPVRTLLFIRIPAEVVELRINT